MLTMSAGLRICVLTLLFLMTFLISVPVSGGISVPEPASVKDCLGHHSWSVEEQSSFPASHWSLSINAGLSLALSDS